MGQPVNGGNALFKLNGGGIANAIVSNGVATATFTKNTADEAIEVDYQGVSGQFNPSEGEATEHTQNPVQNTVTNVTLSPNPAAPGTLVTITANVQTTP